jgi:hypothetical protein
MEWPIWAQICARYPPMSMEKPMRGGIPRFIVISWTMADRFRRSRLEFAKIPGDPSLIPGNQSFLNDDPCLINDDPCLINDDPSFPFVEKSIPNDELSFLNDDSLLINDDPSFLVVGKRLLLDEQKGIVVEKPAPVRWRPHHLFEKALRDATLAIT